MPISSYLYQAISSGGSSTPSLQQIFVSSSNPNGVGGDAGSAFQHTLAAPVGSGNTIIIAASYPTGTTASISDNNGNSWSSASETVDEGAGGFILSVWTLIGANSGLTTFELNVGATAIQPVAWSIEEWNNISAVDVTAGATGQKGSTLATGSMTTTANGDLIRAYYHPSGNIGNNPSSWAAPSQWTLMDADIAWNSKQGYPKASMYQIQTTAGAVNPTITINNDATDSFNCVAIALKASQTGTMYTGMRVLKHIELTCNALASGTWALQTPCLGNLRVLGNTIANTGVPMNSITDSESNTWTNVSWVTDSCQAAFLQNSVANQNLVSTINWGTGATGNGLTTDFYDIVGAATSGQPGAIASNNLTNISTSATSAPNQPDITPTQTGSIILAFMNNQGAGFGNTPPNAGTTTGVTSPAQAVWGGMTYTGHTGGGQFDFGDGYAIITNNNSTSSQNITWSVIAIGTNGGGAGNNVAGAAVEFLHA